MTRRFLYTLLLVDLPVVALAALVGWRDPVGTAEAFLQWRQANPWTWMVSVPAALMVAHRWRSR